MKNNVTVALIVLYAKYIYIYIYIYPAYVSKHKSGRWHYLAVRPLSALLREIISKTNSDYYFCICLHSFRTKKNLNLIKKYVKIKIFVTFPSEARLII